MLNKAHTGPFVRTKQDAMFIRSYLDLMDVTAVVRPYFSTVSTGFATVYHAHFSIVWKEETQDDNGNSKASDKYILSP